MKYITAALYALLAVGICGCRGTLATFQTARTMPKGGFQIAAEGSAVGAISEVGTKHEGSLSVAGRYAVTDRVEIGARIGVSRPELMAKIRLDKGGPSSVAFSVAPSLGAFIATATGVEAFTTYGQIPLLVGVPFGDHELVLGGAVHLGHAVDLERGVWGFVASPGISAGFSIEPLQWLAVLPEIAVAYPLLHATPAGADSGGAIAYQAGIAILVGNSR